MGKRKRLAIGKSFRWVCTACRSRTGDLLRERQMSWTTRRMRQVALLFFSQKRVQRYEVFLFYKLFLRKKMNYFYK